MAKVREYALNTTGLTPAEVSQRHDDIQAEDIPTSFESPDSRSVISGTYDIDTETMVLTFRRGVTHTITYQYNGFPLKVWVGLAQAESKGTYFARNIRPMFQGTPKS